MAIVVSKPVASIAAAPLANTGSPAARPMIRIIASAVARTWLRALNFL